MENAQNEIQMKVVLRNACLVNEGKQMMTDVLIVNERIEKIASNIQVDGHVEEYNLQGNYLLPGVIDAHVHFREPGLTHKAEIATDSYAAIAGGTTSYMEMPNTIPNAVTQEVLAEKYALGAAKSFANYSFYMGTTNDNYDEVMRTDLKNVCGIKIFMGSSTGNMLVDNEDTLNRLFGNFEGLISTHCEDECTMKENLAKAQAVYGDAIPIEQHPIIRSAEGCFLSTSYAVDLAKKYNTRLHILHVSTEREADFFDNSIPLKDKRITAEVCVHHLWFSDKDYAEKGAFIRWNPAIKTEQDKLGLLKGLLEDRLDVIGTDHAPHLPGEKANDYMHCPGGGPMVQHSLLAMLDFYANNQISIEKIVEKMAHAPAVCYKVEDRGFVREGYFADLVVVKKQDYQVTKENILYKCGWSPFENHSFKFKVDKTFVNGRLVYADGENIRVQAGKQLTFDRP